MVELSILLVGNTSRREFRGAVALLEAYGRLLRAGGIEGAWELLEDGRAAPDLVVIAQAYPGQFGIEAVHRLRRAAPLARVIGLMGSWCEGELRTGTPWPAAIRVYWHQWEPRVDQELKRLAAGSSRTWGLPATAGEEERILAVAGEPLEPRSGQIAIIARQFAMRDWIAAACRRRGYATLALGEAEVAPLGPVTAVIFDGTGGTGPEIRSLQQAVSAFRDSPVVALLDFPRVEDRDRLLASGAAAVMSKPFLLEDLFWELDRVTQLTRPAAIR